MHVYGRLPYLDEPPGDWGDPGRLGMLSRLSPKRLTGGAYSMGTNTALELPALGHEVIV